MTNKNRGHYCKICGEYKSNESFSGKGHANHICKKCSTLSAADKSEAMTLTRLENLSGRISTDEMKWLVNRTRDKKDNVRQLANSIFENFKR